jgi:hypothetical protein
MPLWGRIRTLPTTDGFTRRSRTRYQSSISSGSRPGRYQAILSTFKINWILGLKLLGNLEGQQVGFSV